MLAYTYIHVEKYGMFSFLQGFRLVRERKRVAWILLLLALLFAACWLPHSILNLLLDTGDFTETKWLMPYCILLGHANSAINPIIYCFMTRNFRRSVKELVFRTRNNFTTRRTNRGQVSITYISTLLYLQYTGILCRFSK